MSKFKALILKVIFYYLQKVAKMKKYDLRYLKLKYLGIFLRLTLHKNNSGSKLTRR